jgi:hypothetical protein
VHLQHKQQELETEAAHLMQKRIFTSMRGALHRQRALKEAEQQVKSQRDTRVMKEVIGTLNGMREVREMRERCLDRLFQRLRHRAQALGFYKIRSHALKITNQQAAAQMRAASLQGRSFKALRLYQARKAKQDADFRIARKFCYVTLLQKGLRALQGFQRWKLRQVELKAAALSLRRKLLLKRTWSLLNGVDEETL